jgi:hypothetical protein
MKLLLLALAVSLAPPDSRATDASIVPGADATVVHGMTISCQTWGVEWGSDGFGAELDDLARLGVNWVAIHPYAAIRADGRVEARRFDPEHPPEWITRPIREAHARGISILVVPHLAYWGSPWRWRGDIDFAAPDELARFFETYTAWIAGVAHAAREADGFCVGNEMEKLFRHESSWRAVIAAVRAQTPARLTYAANFSSYADVPFWDALDAVGVQGYFPLCDGAAPSDADLRVGWRAAIAGMRAVHERTGKPVVLTELGYDVSLDAAREPWKDGRARGPDRARGEELQGRCLSIALSEIDRERGWLRGAFLWKWFVGGASHETFLMKTPAMRAVIGKSWSGS